MDESSNNPNPATRSNYPLSALFVLIAVCAILLAMVSHVIRAVVEEQAGALHVVGLSIAGGFATAVLGTIVGVYHYRPLVGILTGAVTGFVIGVLVGPIPFANEKYLVNLLFLAFGGSLLLLVMGVVFRVNSTVEPFDGRHVDSESRERKDE